MDVAALNPPEYSVRMLAAVMLATTLLSSTAPACMMPRSGLWVALPAAARM